MTMSVDRSYSDELQRIADNLMNPDIDLEASSVGQRYRKTEAEVFADVQRQHPILWHETFANQDTFPIESGVAGMIDAFGVTDEDVAHIKATESLYLQVLPRGHLIAIVGLSGAGKTTVLEHICGQIEGQVLYINADISASDIPEALRRANAGRYDLLCPDIKVGRSLDEVLQELKSLAVSNEDLSNTVFVIDTLKKFTDLISKAKASETYKLLRALTGRGATVICLGHCNKYLDSDGWPIYEGTGDLRSDFDELGLLHAHRGDYGLITVSLYWDEQGWPSGKTRAELRPQSWEIDREKNRTVLELDKWVDTVKLSKESHETRKTVDVIREIYFLLQRNGGMTQSDILQRMEGRHGKHVVRRVLKQQEGKAWEIIKGPNNASIHTAIESADIPKPESVRWGQQK